MRKIYFAHPINTYGTPLEERCLADLRRQFPFDEIVNPSDQVHKDMVTLLRKDDPNANVMPYFESIAASCDNIVVLPFADGMWGAGVWAEADKIQQKGGRAWVMDPQSGKLTSVPRTRLTVEETRARIRNPDGTSKPYA